MSYEGERYTSKTYKMSLLTVLAVYVLLYGWMLVSSDFAPYAMDGNESYSSLLHAYNLYRFDFSKSFGLTDESASPDPAAHPFVHTHQGNFPRLFAYVIYLFGARSIESQIVITTFTVGLASIVFCFIFFCRTSGPLFAATISILLMSDYWLFSQWQVVTYRVWYGFLLFSSLLCAQGIGRQKKIPWAILAILNHMCLFYGELVFAGFTALLTGLYTGWLHRRKWKTVLLGWGVQIAGAVAGLSVVVTQLILYLGKDDFLEDLYLTFVARNYASQDPSLMQKLTEFYNSHDIVFWYNLKSAGTYAGVGKFLQSIFSYGFLTHTPFLALITLLVVFGWLAGVGASWIGHFRIFASLDHVKEEKALIALAFPLAFALVVLLYKFVVEDVRLAGGISSGLTIPIGRFGLLAILALPLVAYLTGLVIRWAWNSFPMDGGAPVAKVLVVVLYLWGAGLFVSLQTFLYDQEWRLLWVDALGPAYFSTALIVACAAVAIGIVLIVLTPERALLGGNADLKGTLPFLASGLVSFLIVYKLAPGYVHSGYLERYAPFVVFHVDCLFAMALFILLSASRTAFIKLKAANSLKMGSLVVAWGKQPAFLFFVSLTLAGYFLVYWSVLQVRCLELVPYNRLAFMKMLGEPPFRGSSFVVNTYAAPVFLFTGKWAYYDSEIEKGRQELTPGGVKVGRNLSTLWFTDRNTRMDYLKPEYFLCFLGWSFHSLATHLSADGHSSVKCKDLEIVKQASSKGQTFLRHQLVAQDHSSDNFWAVVKLDWGYPPFLGPLTSENGATVQLDVTKTSRGRVGVVDYQYRHQEGQPEGETHVRLFRVDRTPLGVGTAVLPEGRSLIAEGIRQRRFPIPEHFQGYLQATVTPATGTKSGLQYESQLIWVSAAGHAR